MVYYLFSLNVNGNWIDMELKSRITRETVIKYNDKPVASGNLSFWSGSTDFYFVVDEDGARVHYFVEAFPVHRGFGFSVSQNGVRIFVTHRNRRSFQQ